MTLTTDTLSPVEKTLLVTLAGRAADARKTRPVLGDQLAAKVFDRLGPDAYVELPGTVTMATAIRSAMLDRLVARFIEAHPDAVVVEIIFY